MYTQVGRTLSRAEAQQFLDMVRIVHSNMQVDELTLRFKNPAVSTVIKVEWHRQYQGRNGDWESLSVEYQSTQRGDFEDELFDSHQSFAEAYGLK